MEFQIKYRKKKKVNQFLPSRNLNIACEYELQQQSQKLWKPARQDKFSRERKEMGVMSKTNWFVGDVDFSSYNTAHGQPWTVENPSNALESSYFSVGSGNDWTT